MTLSPDCIVHILSMCDIDTRIAFGLKPGKLKVSEQVKDMLMCLTKNTKVFGLTTLILKSPSHATMYGIAVQSHDGDFQKTVMRMKADSFDVWRTLDGVEYTQQCMDAPILMLFML